MRLLSFLAGLAALLTAAPALAQTAPAPAPPLEPENSWHLDLSTGGRVTIQLRPDMAPNHVERIKTLTRRGFYDGLIFHRVIEGFMAQGGDPTGTGTGSSDLPDLGSEINGLPHLRGAVAMARGQELNSGNSQFYIMFVPRMSMDDEYSVFGRVVRGMNFVDAIERGEPPLNPTRIVRASIGSDNVAELPADQLRAAAAAPVQPAVERPAALQVDSLPGAAATDEAAPPAAEEAPDQREAATAAESPEPEEAATPQ